MNTPNASYEINEARRKIIEENLRRQDELRAKLENAKTDELKELLKEILDYIFIRLS